MAMACVDWLEEALDQPMHDYDEDGNVIPWVPDDGVVDYGEIRPKGEPIGDGSGVGLAGLAALIAALKAEPVGTVKDGQWTCECGDSGSGGGDTSAALALYHHRQAKHVSYHQP